MEDTNKAPLRDNAQEKKSTKTSIWNIDNDELEKQVDQYHTLKPYQSYRGISTLLLSFGMIASILLQTVFGTSFLVLLAETAIVSVLIYFIYRGHRWAMVLFILSFTANLLVTSLGRIVEGTFSVSSAFIFGGIWIVVVSTLIKAIRIENHKRKYNLPRTGVIERSVDVSSAKVSDAKSVSKPAAKITFNRRFTLKQGIIALVGLIIVVGGTLFWWYEIRVNEIKRECSWVERVEAEKPATIGITAEEARRMNDEITKNNNPQCQDDSLRTLERLKLGCREANVRETAPTQLVPENRYYTPASDREYQLCLRHKGLQ